MELEEYIKDGFDDSLRDYCGVDVYQKVVDKVHVKNAIKTV